MIIGSIPSKDKIFIKCNTIAMGGACSTYGESRGVYRGNLRERDHLEDPD
jgi:hypothetical protein